MSKGKHIGYIRVSTGDESTERQLDGVELDMVFIDKASGRMLSAPNSRRRWTTSAMVTR